MPASYDVTTFSALIALRNRPVGITAVWALYAFLILMIALGRAASITRNQPNVRWTTLRGSVWLWGAIASPWIFVLAVWDLQLYDAYVTGLSYTTKSTPVLTVAQWWWLSGLLAVMIGATWSTSAAVLAVRTARRRVSA